MSKIAKRSTMTIVFFGLLTGATVAQAKNLNQRLGVGYKNNTIIDVPSIAVQYYPTAEYALYSSLGIDTQKDNSKFQLNVGAKRNLFMGTEPNMNFFVGGQVGTVTDEVAAKKESGMELQAFVGAEFFLPGLESLSFTFEAGLGMSTVDSARFRTLGNDPLRAGILFYF